MYKVIKLLFEYTIVNLLFIFLSFLPVQWVTYIGGKIFKLMGPLSKANKIAKENYKKVFTNSNNKEIDNNISKSWENLGKTIFEISVLEKIIDENRKKIKLKGIKNIESVIKKKEKVIFFSIHQSNWEILVPSIDKLNIRVGAIYRHINNKYIDKLILKKRNQSIKNKKSFYTPKGKKSAKEIIKSLNEDTSIILLIDQKDSSGDNVKLFDNMTKTQTGFLKIARKKNLKLIPVKNIRLSNNNFEITFCKAITPYLNYNTDAEAMLDIHKIIEGWIRENPSQWFWQHKRFS